jgi:hypothetical protein
MNPFEFITRTPVWGLPIWKRCWLVFLAVFIYGSIDELAGRGCAQDFRQLAEDKFGKDSRIWFSEPGDRSLDRWEPRELFEDFGIILEWSEQNVVLVRPEAKSESTISGDTVVRIEPSWTSPAAEKIHRLFEQNQFQAVAAQGNEAIKLGGMPRWQQRVILAEMIESRSALGAPDAAGKLFSVLAKLNPPQLLIATIPIPWGSETLDANLPKIQRLAEEWILDENEAVQLMGAAWLLSGQKRAIAIESLENLAKNSKSQILRSYAKAQLWRTTPPAELISDRYPKWLAERDSLLLPIQAGPTMLLAERLAQAGQPVLAISEWLRIATLHADRYHLASKAILKAVAALRSLGRNEEAYKAELLLKRYEIKTP